ncbi:efflux RND transporter periplasmic adaptor subunit [Sphingomonas sp. UYP23]
MSGKYLDLTCARLGKTAGRELAAALTTRDSFRLGASALPAVLILTGCSAQTQEVEKAPAVVQVAAVALAPTTVSRELNGQVVPTLTAEIRPQIGGIVKRRLFTEGTDVYAGDVLFTIEDRLYVSAFGEAKAQLENARASQAAAAVKAKRFATLQNTNAASAQDVDDALTASRQADALVHEREAALATARANLDYTRIRSPISGRIGRSQITVGALVTPGQAAPLATVQSIDSVFADLALPLGQGGGDGTAEVVPASGSAVRLLAGGDAGQPLSGRVEFTDATIAQGTQSAIVRVRVTNRFHELLPGLFVRGAIEETVAPSATMIPQQAVTVGSGSAGSVLIVNRQNRAVRRAVVLGQAIGANWIIRSGLAQGERVIMTGGAKIAPGDTVRPHAVTNEGGKL